MKNNTWKKLSLLLVALLCLTVLAACGGNNSAVSEIFVQKSELPRTNYVKGQELDLSKGALTAVIDNETTLIPMTNPDVTVTGYDSNKVGKQTLTITYKGKSTTFDVIVSERVVAEGYQADYFVGTAFDNSKGKLCITKDDGTMIAINLNSPEIVLRSFDSSKAGQSTVTVLYNGEETYECSFQVNVHEASKLTLITPKKTRYNSHETELSLSGGYLKVEVANVAGLSMSVPLTADMITGYDPSVVTYENRDQVVTQTLTVTYSGLTATYDVQISYSDVHLVQHLAGTLSHLNWDAEEMPTLTEEEENNAIAAIEAYLGLTPAEQGNITQEQLHHVLFPAVIALRDRYVKELETFGDAFGVTDDGRLAIYGKTAEAVSTAVERLSDENDPFNYYAALQLQIGQELGNTAFRDATLNHVMMAHGEETANALVDLFSFLLDIHKALSNVPADWTVDNLHEYEVPIANAVSKISFSQYIGVDYNYLYEIISSWREKNDMSELIFSYYYYVKEGGQNEIKSKLWQMIPMPGQMNVWYACFMSAYQQEQFLMNNVNTGAYLADTSGFLFYYFQADQIAREIKAGDDELLKGIYEVLDCDALFDTYLTNGPCGYMYHMGAGLDSKAVQDAWEKYMVIIDIYVNDPQATFSKYETEFRAGFDMLVNMSSEELYNFLCSVHFLYEASRGTVLVMDTSTQSYSTLMALLYRYHTTVLSEEVMPLYSDLLLAMENYSLRNLRESGLADFKELVEKVNAAYKTLGAEDKAAFDTYLGAAYSKCLTLYTRVNAKDPVNMGQWEDKINQLVELLRKSDEIIGHATSDETSVEEKSRILPVYFAVVEKADALYIELMNAGDEVALEMQTRLIEVSGYQLTVDYYHLIVKRLFVNFMMNTVIQVEGGGKYAVWSMYHDSAVRPLLAQMTDLLLACYNNEVYTGEDIYEIMDAFRALKPEEKNTFFILGVNLTYYAAVETYFGSRVTGGSELIRALIYAEINYSVHTYTNTEESLNAFTSKVEEMMELYKALEDKAAFDQCLGEMYNLYLGLYNELKTQE